MNKSRIFTIIPILSILLIWTSMAGEISFQWPNQLIKNCPAEITIMMDTNWEEINTAWINILLDDSFTINQYNITEWVLRTYVNAKKMTARKGEYKWKDFLRLLWTSSSSKWFKWKWIFAKLMITPKSDTVNLDFYMIDWYDGEDSNLTSNIDWKITDILNTTNSLKIPVVEWECTIWALDEIDLNETNTTWLLISEVMESTEENIQVIKENIFDISQETNRFKRNLIYIAIVFAAIIIITLILILTKKTKKTKKTKETK